MWTTVLHCDHCGATVDDTAEERWVARLRAESHGWEVDDRDARCPDCVGRRR